MKSTDTALDFGRVFDCVEAALQAKEAKLRLSYSALCHRCSALTRELRTTGHRRDHMVADAIARCDEVACGLAACPQCRLIADMWLSLQMCRFVAAHDNAHLVVATLPRPGGGDVTFPLSTTASRSTLTSPMPAYWTDHGSADTS